MTFSKYDHCMSLTRRHTVRSFFTHNRSNDKYVIRNSREQDMRLKLCIVIRRLRTLKSLSLFTWNDIFTLIKSTLPLHFSPLQWQPQYFPAVFRPIFSGSIPNKIVSTIMELPFPNNLICVAEPWPLLPFVGCWTVVMAAICGRHRHRFIIITSSVFKKKIQFT